MKMEVDVFGITNVILATWLILTCILAPRTTRAQGEFQTGHIQTSDGVKLHYLEAGSGPAIVFVPGLTMPAEIWEHQFRHFASTHHIVTFDGTKFTSRFISLQLEREELTRKFISTIHRSPQSDEYFEAMTEAALLTPTTAAAMMIANLILMGPTDLRPALDSLDRPALFITSSLDWAVEQAKKVREGWPEIQEEVIDETSHALFVDKQEEFNQALEKFIATLPKQ